MSTIRHLVWDWNGTLFDDCPATFDALLEVLAWAGQAPVDERYYRTRFRRPIHEFYEEIFGRTIGAEEWASLDDEFHRRYLERLAKIGLAPDAEEALERAEVMGLTQSLLSMWRHDDLLVQVDSFGLSRFFVFVDGLRGPGGGPKAEHLVEHVGRLQREHGILPGEVLLVGDTTDDAAAAAHAGVRCVLYEGGIHLREVLETTGLPVAGSLREVLTLSLSDSRGSPR